MSAAGPSMPEAMLEIMGSVATILESVQGYRSQCEAAGFSPTAAEAMAMDLHRGMINATFQVAR